MYCNIHSKCMYLVKKRTKTNMLIEKCAYKYEALSVSRFHIIKMTADTLFNHN